MNLVLDAGALIAVDRDDRRVAGLVELGRRAGATLVTVVAQAWRGSGRQARLARQIRMIDVRPTGLVEALHAGELVGRAGTSDVVDALLALVAVPGDQVLTSDPDDLRHLFDHRNLPLTVVPV